jgi:hypothetical protein
MTKFAQDFGEDMKDRSWDLHGGNYMIRDDDTIVLTDPVCGVAETTVPRFKNLHTLAEAA